MKKVLVLVMVLGCQAQAWTVTAVAKGPNQINLTWQPHATPGYGYIVEIQSDTDSRYSSYTELRPIPVASGYTCDPAINWQGHGTGCNISDPTGTKVYNPAIKFVPTWVTEPQYLDPQDDSAAQFIATGLRNNTAYNFRVRTFQGMTGTTYNAYSSVATVTTANYAKRYVSLSGDNSDGLTLATAWTNLTALGSAPCGVLVLVSGGDYQNEYINLSQSCGTGNKLVIQAAYGESPRLYSNLHPDWGAALQIYGTHIVVDGLIDAESFADPNGDYSLLLAGTRNALFGMDIGPRADAIPSTYGGVKLTAANGYNLVYGNYIHDAGTPYEPQNGSLAGGFLITMYGGGYNTVWSNHLTRGAHDCGLVHDGQYNKWLNNVHDGGWGMGFETVYNTSAHNLFEGSIVRWPGALTTAYKPGFEFSWSDNVVRRSIFTDGPRNGIEISAYWFGSRNLVYNNVFYGFDKCYFQSQNEGASAYDGTKVQNNICRFTSNTAATEIYLANTTSQAIAYNSIVKVGAGDGAVPNVVWNQSAGAPYDTPVTMTYAEANYGAGSQTWYHNVTNSSKEAVFVDPANMDFHLAADSGLQGQGNRLTDPDWGLSLAANLDIGVYGLIPSNAVPRVHGGKVVTKTITR